MADTDDEQTDRARARPARAGRRRHRGRRVSGDGARAWERDGERPAAVAGLTPEEEAARRQEELDAGPRRGGDRAGRTPRRSSSRPWTSANWRSSAVRREVLAAAETTEAMRLAEAEPCSCAATSDAEDAGRPCSDWAHGHHQLDEAAARPGRTRRGCDRGRGPRVPAAADREDRRARTDDARRPVRRRGPRPAERAARPRTRAATGRRGRPQPPAARRRRPASSTASTSRSNGRPSPTN